MRLNMDDLKKWLDERDAVVASMDLEKMKEWMKKHSPVYPPILPPDEVIEITMRKMAVHITSLDIETRVSAFRWLLERGYDFSLDG